LKRFVGIYAHAAHRVPHLELGPGISDLLKAYAAHWQVAPSAAAQRSASVSNGLARLFLRFDEARDGMSRCQRAPDTGAGVMVGCETSNLVTDVQYVTKTTGQPLIGSGNVQALTNKVPYGRIAEVVDFIASSALVLTSTYHGMFWATILRVPVIVFGVFSSKFHSFPWPTVGWSGNLTLDAANAGQRERDYASALQYCRDANHAFHKRFQDLLFDHHATYGRGGATIPR